ncbi:MAG TPA: hypothetical protein VJU78_17030 [Chitinophagaceae bacterium]|nr:hypothetical protein [Chitinophagaceae bacterium]
MYIFFINEYYRTFSIHGIFLSLNNNSIKFQVYRASLYVIGENKVTDPKFLITITKKSSDAKTLKSISREDWLAALNNPKCDWAANLLLYEMYKKDATTFEVVKTREQWLNGYKQTDIEFWQKELK